MSAIEDLKQIDIDRQTKFEKHIIDEFEEEYNLEKRGYGRYKYSDIQQRWNDFLFGSYPYSVLSIEQKERVDRLIKEAIELEQKAAEIRRQIDLIKRGRIL